MDYASKIEPFMQGNFAELGLWYGLGVIVLLLWTLVWKGLALWHAAKNGQKFWFIAMLILNTVGILEVVYYFLFREKGQKGHELVEENFPAKDIEEEKK